MTYHPESTFDGEIVNYFFHHIFLPSKLPGGEDSSPRKDVLLIAFVLESLERFLDQEDPSNHDAIRTSILMMENMRAARDAGGYLQEDGVRAVLRRVSSPAENYPEAQSLASCNNSVVPPDAVAPFLITAQNSGVIARFTTTSIIFELFELSPTNQSVNTARGRLVRQFPAVAIGIPQNVFAEENFRSVIAKTLVKMSRQVVDETQTKAKKAKQMHNEDRETTHPRIITELFSSFLRGVGEHVQVSGICKNTREEVVWKDSKLPWRRSSLWLLIRISLQLTMHRVSVEFGNVYKSFMVFLMARVLEAARQKTTSSDVLQTMTMKITRRLLKLAPLTMSQWMTFVQMTISETSSLLNRRWKEIQKQEEPQIDLPALSKLNMAKHTGIRLPDLDDFVLSIQQRDTAFQFSLFRPTSYVEHLSPENLPRIRTDVEKGFLPYCLVMFESWIAKYLDDWLDKNLQDTETCSTLCTIIKEYHSSSKKIYDGDPQGASRMILVVLELWVAADKAAIHAIPLLRSYKTEIPFQEYQELLLAFEDEMKRIRCVESYLMQRQKYAEQQGNPSIFRSYGKPRSFPVQYFLQSPLHIHLMNRIEQRAQDQRQEKLEEFRRLHAEYETLIQLYSQGSCQTMTLQENGVWYNEHAPYCNRCALMIRAGSLSIRVHEWPLSDDKLKAQTTVFELALPTVFGVWRDTTLYVIDDVFQSQSFSEERPEAPSYPLREYHGLSDFFLSERAWRVHLLSSTKPHVVTHRKDREISVSSESDVCLNNGLCFQYFDESRKTFLSEFDRSLEISDLCTFKLPLRSEVLRSFLVRNFTQPSGETPNRVIASQATCPAHMSLGEYKALAGLSFGFRIHWMSILTQLAMPDVDFNKAETAIFLLQLSLQIGPGSSEHLERPSHGRLSESIFGHTMLNYLQTNLLRVKENWQSHVSLWIFTFLATRLLSKVPEELREPFLDLLQQCRGISYQWFGKLRTRAYETVDDKERIQYLRTGFQVCLICADSFNVDDRFLSQILSQPEQSAILMEISINVNNSAQLMKSATEESLERIMHARWRHILHRARPVILDEIILNNNACLDIAIKKCWPACSNELVWQLAPSTCDWLEAISVGAKIHVNILSGELLVDGLPLSRLPHEYQLHNDYERLFGAFVLEVMPSSRPAMQFCSAKTFEGYTVHFGMKNDVSSLVASDLLIRLEDKDSVRNLIPSRVLRGFLPHSFVEDYVHWYNDNTKTVAFCPIKRPWNFDVDGWTLCQHNADWQLTRGGEVFVLAPTSDSAKRIAEIFSRLDDSLNLHMLLDQNNGFLEVKIPRLELEFRLNCGESSLRSKQHRGMQIDADQSVGTLVGLKSKLVLKSYQNQQKRMILIPEGKIQYERSVGDHVTVSVAYGSARRVQRYIIDDQLCRLIDNTCVKSKLYLAYLHALTSYCLPDAFSGRNGTEEALAILQSASIRSVDFLSADEIEILQHLAALTPSRLFYPQHLRTMQTVKWSNELSFLAQDSRFYQIVKAIIERATEMRFLYPSDAADSIKLTPVDLTLVEREILRNSRLQVSSFGAEAFTVDHDVEYESRDHGQQSLRCIDASRVSFKINYGLQSLQYQIESVRNLWDDLYRMLSHDTKTPASRQIPKQQEMEYDSAWLLDPPTFISSFWCRFHYAFQSNPLWLNKFQMMIWFTTLSYSTKNCQQLTQALLMLAMSPSISATPLPEESLFDLQRGYSLDQAKMRDKIESKAKELINCPEASLIPLAGESGKATLKRRKRLYKERKDGATNAFLRHLTKQWPCETPIQQQEDSLDTYIDSSSAIRSITPEWRKWYANLQFRKYLESIVLRLNNLPVENVSINPVIRFAKVRAPCRPRGFVSVDDILSNAPSPKIQVPSLGCDALVRKMVIGEDASNKLDEVLYFLDLQAKFEYERRYLSELRNSLRKLHGRSTIHLNDDSVSTRSILFETHLTQCQMHVQEVYNALLLATSPQVNKAGKTSADSKETIRSMASTSKFWPRVSPIFFLQQLARSRWPYLSKPWQESIIAYGIAITTLQRAQRLVQVQSNEVDLLRELENIGHQGWDSYKYPEWLLLECESGIMIREVQQQIAEHMISPQENQNAVMQLNMGEGKSSVIVPIVASALSHGSQLVRVIVAKPQAKQMYQMLASKLSGLLNRPVYRMPFSRTVRMDKSRAAVVQKLITQCTEEGGVMMVQPEHLLSFQLMGLECQINGDDKLSGDLLKLQQIFNTSSRDIVDESDENFSVKFELIYTIGMQRPIEHTPDRWVIIQEVLRLFAKICKQEKERFPESIEIDDRDPGRFPRIRILRDDAASAILDLVSKSICDMGMTGFPVGRQSLQTRTAIQRYITNRNVSPGDINAVENSPFWDETVINYILMLRGLMSGGILAFAFGQKRWRVDYGTDLNRETTTRLAVPFRAKDNPTPRSEFSHPDVVILLTCLSYYYKGLVDDELFATLELLLKSDNADLEYQEWVETAPGLPIFYRQLSGINVRDRIKCVAEIFPYLRYSKGTIDFFLSRMVFAKESKEFPHKLSSSGWDLAKKKGNPTTGFSGTNDSQYVLPLGIQQLDLPEQTHTNALVLKYLLRPENGIRLMPRQMTGATMEISSFLEMVATMSSNTRVILDVGAQIIDLDNLQFATLWLKRYEHDSKVQAAIFFSDSDELMVLDKSGKVEAFQTSPFASQLDQCLVFLDEAHTRGTDLRLPIYYQAAVTLGANLTKDKLVQACMRMRKLGQGQSVVFCVPREIEQKIQLLRGSASSGANEMTVSDVLCWIISETWLDLRRMVPLWLNQGVRFYEQEKFWNEVEDLGSKSRTEWAKQFLEDEAQSLDFRYRPRGADADSSAILRRAGTMSLHFQRRCQEFGLTEFRAASLQEEQERELSPETEREQQVELPPAVEPWSHTCHEDLRYFVTHGEFPIHLSGFKPAFRALGDTSAAEYLDVDTFPSYIWVTEDFSRTVKMNQGAGTDRSDLFQRSPQWILTSTSEDNAIHRLVIISPYEAQELLLDIEQSRHVTLHLYAPRCNIGFQALDHLTLYTTPRRRKPAIIPPDMMVHLNLFAGQLYLSSYQEYIEMCDHLGLAWNQTEETIALGPDGFIPPGLEGTQLLNKSGFKKSPTKFLKVLITKIRRNCEVVDKTHVGRILDGVLLVEDDFD